MAGVSIFRFNDKFPILSLTIFCFCRDGIIEDQRAYEKLEFREQRSVYGPYMCQLPAEMLAVITMHRLIGLLMSCQENGCVKVTHAALLIGEAVEQEVCCQSNM